MDLTGGWSSPVAHTCSAASRRRAPTSPRIAGGGGAMSHAPSAGLEIVPAWIQGKPIVPASPRSGTVWDPANGRPPRRVPFCDAAAVDAAVQAAASALPQWAATPPLRRARVLQRFLQALQANQGELARIASEEHGKTR